MIPSIKADGKAEYTFIELLQSRAQSMSVQTAREVEPILVDVRSRGDDAVLEYCRKFDGAAPASLRLSKEEIDRAAGAVFSELYAVMSRAADNIRAYHQKQLATGYLHTRPGVVMGQRVLPLDRVGIYVPGGAASYPSSVLMNALPAVVAGVRQIAMVTPVKQGGLTPAIAAAAQIAGVEEIYAVGGAQAVAALAYGTRSIPRVDKIVGPGNRYVSMAKKLVYGEVDIDMIAGPSEILIIADGSANPAYLAADLMSQAEHDPLASAVLLCDSEDLAREVTIQLEKQIQTLSRREIIEKSLADYGAIIVTPTIDRAVELSNLIAPEHLELALAEPMGWLDKVKNAGSVFLGQYTPEPLGDYYAGANHVLPTNGTARFASPLGVDAFVKRSSYLCYSREALLREAADVIAFAECEGLTAHANSIAIRSKS